MRCCSDQSSNRSLGDVANRPARLANDDRIRLIDELGVDGVQLNVYALYIFRAECELTYMRSKFGDEFRKVLRVYFKPRGLTELLAILSEVSDGPVEEILDDRL